MSEKTSIGTRYEVHVRPDLYEADRPGLAWPAKAAILVTVVGTLAALRHPLISVISAALP